MFRFRVLFAAFLVVGSAICQGQGYISGVPDTWQPPVLPPWLVNPNNWCAPTAAANLIEYWDVQRTGGVAGGFTGRTLAGQVGWFMDTNDQVAGKGVPNDFHSGTHFLDPRGSGFDAITGLANFARWDGLAFFGLNNLPYPAPTPAGKNGYPWVTTPIVANGFQNAKNEIDAGRPLLSGFNHWDVFDTFQTIQIGNDVFPVWNFNEPHAGASGGGSAEGDWEQDFGLGHLVTTVGYYPQFLLEGVPTDLLIVHDTIPDVGFGFTTPKDLAIVYDAHWTHNLDVDPVPEPSAVAALGFGIAALLLRRPRIE